MGLLLAGLLGLTLLNSVLLFVLWGSNRGTSPTPPATTGQTEPASAGTSERAANPAPVVPDPASSIGDGRATARELDAARETPLIRKNPDLDRSPAGSTPGSADSGSPVATPAKTEPPPREVVEVRLRRPAGLHDEALAELFHAPPGPGLDRHLVLLALSRWGEEFAPRARDLLQVEVPRLAAAFAEGIDPEAEDEFLLLRRTLERSERHRSVRSELAAIEQVWSGRWRALLDKIAADPARGWRRAIAVADRPGPIDLVLLVDLSESMTDEIAGLRAALQKMVPELLRARPDLRVGWIGYRDEVVDKTPLTSDLTVLRDSFDRFRCEGGGDVPEALDEALFEAFRVGGFPWRPDARHRFLVIGDAPPPYDRIEGMVELARAAHESPEGFVIDTLGLIREPEFPEIPAFQALAEGTTGRVQFLEPKDLSLESWWGAILRSGQPRWSDRPDGAATGRD